mgnify:CR=1 FL=1
MAAKIKRNDTVMVMAGRENGKTGKVIVTCVDADPPHLQLVREGVITAAVGQRRELFTYLGLKILFDINPSAFVPPPKVTSSVVEFIPRANPLPCSRRALERVTEAPQQRRRLEQKRKRLGPEPREALAHHRGRAVEPRVRIRHVHRRQHGLAVGEA